MVQTHKEGPTIIMRDDLISRSRIQFLQSHASIFLTPRRVLSTINNVALRPQHNVAMSSTLKINYAPSKHKHLQYAAICMQYYIITITHKQF